MVGSAVGYSHVQRHVLAVKHFSDGALHCLHELGGDAHFAVAAENSE